MTPVSRSSAQREVIDGGMYRISCRPWVLVGGLNSNILSYVPGLMLATFIPSSTTITILQHFGTPIVQSGLLPYLITSRLPYLTSQILSPSYKTAFPTNEYPLSPVQRAAVAKLH